jgi:CelD/BcsL family acetyltransferase involved in cellulose biosynthesis
MVINVMCSTSLNVIESAVDFYQLKVDWLLIEKNSNNHFFLSWEWMSNWLDTYKISPRIFKFYHGSTLVGLCCLCPYKSSFNSLFQWKSAFLHKTGEANQDQIWIEYNDVLCIKGYEESGRQALIEFFKKDKHIDELVLGPSPQEYWTDINIQPCFQYVSWEQKAYAFKLKPEFQDFKILLQQWSKNTRNQIRRSLKLYQEMGELKIITSDSIETSLQWFEQSAMLHQQRWDNSGFSNPNFVNFHTNLIRKTGNVDILKLTVSDSVLAYLYNFKYKGQVYFYLSAIDYDVTNNKLKPGLTAHALAIQIYSKQGYELYDFMGGESQYKKSLSNLITVQHIIKVQKPKLSLKIIRLLRKLNSYLK